MAEAALAQRDDTPTAGGGLAGDCKEGIKIGRDLPLDHPLVRAGPNATFESAGRRERRSSRRAEPGAAGFHSRRSAGPPSAYEGARLSPLPRAKEGEP